MSVQKIKYTYLIVSDMDAAVAFYTAGLGLRLKFQDGQRWAELDAGGGTTLALSSAEESGLRHDGPIVVFQADQAEGLRATLEGQGARAVSERDMGGHGRLVAYRDPFGGVFQILEKP